MKTYQMIAMVAMLTASSLEALAAGCPTSAAIKAGIEAAMKKGKGSGYKIVQNGPMEEYSGTFTVDKMKFIFSIPTEMSGDMINAAGLNMEQPDSSCTYRATYGPQKYGLGKIVSPAK